MSYQITCRKAYFDEYKRIFCNVTHTPCAHVFLCRLNGKWKQTEKAASCPLKEGEKDGK